MPKTNPYRLIAIPEDLARELDQEILDARNFDGAATMTKKQFVSDLIDGAIAAARERRARRAAGRAKRQSQRNRTLAAK